MNDCDIACMVTYISWPSDPRWDPVGNRFKFVLSEAMRLCFVTLGFYYSRALFAEAVVLSDFSKALSCASWRQLRKQQPQGWVLRRELVCVNDPRLFLHVGRYSLTNAWFAWFRRCALVCHAFLLDPWSTWRFTDPWSESSLALSQWINAAGNQCDIVAAQELCHWHNSSWDALSAFSRTSGVVVIYNKHSKMLWFQDEAWSTGKTWQDHARYGSMKSVSYHPDARPR